MIQLLKILRLLDDDGTVSLSNILLIVLIIKIGVAPQLDWTVMAGLALTLVNYSFKKHIRLKQQDKQQDINNDSAKLRADVEELAKQVALVRISGD